MADKKNLCAQIDTALHMRVRQEQEQSGKTLSEYMDAEERILSAEYNTKVCEISLLQISGKVTKYLE